MPKIIGQSIGEHRERTRDRLFEAVADLLAEKSYEQITLSMVARRANVGRTAIYNHFPDKDGLLFDYVNQTTADFADNLHNALELCENPLDQLCVYVRYQLSLKLRGNIVWRADLRTLVADQNRERFHEHALVIEGQLSTILHHAMGLGLLPRRDVWSLTRLIHSSIAAVSTPTTDEERAETFSLVEGFVLGGVGASPDYSPPPFEDQDLLSSPVVPHPVDTEWSMAAVRCPVHHG